MICVLCVGLSFASLAVTLTNAKSKIQVTRARMNPKTAKTIKTTPAVLLLIVRHLVISMEDMVESEAMIIM